MKINSNPLRPRKFRKGHFGNWILLGKMGTKKATCYECKKALQGEQLIYTNTLSKETVAVCQNCVGIFENRNNDKVNPVFSDWNKGIHVSQSASIPGFDDISSKKRTEIFKKTGVII